MEKNKPTGIHVGSSSILVTFVLIALITFATLSLVTVQSDSTLTHNTYAHVQSYYKAYGQSETILGIAADYLKEAYANAADTDAFKHDLADNFTSFIEEKAQDENIILNSVSFEDYDTYGEFNYEIPFNKSLFRISLKIDYKEGIYDIITYNVTSGSKDTVSFTDEEPLNLFQ